MLSRIAFVLLFSSTLLAQSDATSRSWNQPVAPFRIAGNLHYVGANEITSFLVTTPQGHILLDAGFKETVPQILQNIVKLGFRVQDIKIMINSQPHYDHAAGFAQMKKLTGASMVMSRADAPLLARGGLGDFAFGDRFGYEPVKADRIINDGDTVKLGSTSLKAVITPGHTRGCTTWIMKVKDGTSTHDVVFVCSVSAPGYKLVKNEQYPDIVDDFRKSFRILESMTPDIFLAAHGNFFTLSEKRRKLSASPTSNPFLNAAEFQRYVQDSRKQFESQLASEIAKVQQ